MHIYPKRFTYRLVRQGKLFRVDFDLTKPITPPAALGVIQINKTFEAAKLKWPL